MGGTGQGIGVEGLRVEAAGKLHHLLLGDGDRPGMKDPAGRQVIQVELHHRGSRDGLYQKSNSVFTLVSVVVFV